MSNLPDLTYPIFFLIGLPAGMFGVLLSLYHTRSTSGGRLGLVGVLRVLVTGVLVFYMAGPRWSVSRVEPEETAVLLDTSYSISGETWRNALRQSLEQLKDDPEDSNGKRNLYFFGGLYERMWQPNGENSSSVTRSWLDDGRDALDRELLRRINPYRSRIQAATDDVTAIAHGDGGHVVLLTDGHPVPGSEAPTDVEEDRWNNLHVVPLDGGYEQNAAIRKLSVPKRVRPGEPFSVDVNVASNFDTEGQLTVHLGTAGTEQVSFEIGGGERQTVRIGPVTPFAGSPPKEKTSVEIRAEISVQGEDDVTPDNHATTGMVLYPPLRALILSPRDEAGALEQAMTTQGFRVRRESSLTVESLRNQLRTTELLVLETPDGSWWNGSVENEIIQFVRERRGGLLVLPETGPEAHRWVNETSLASLFPVRAVEREKPTDETSEEDQSDDDEKQQEPDVDPDSEGTVEKGRVTAVSVMLVIDTSGSMTERKLNLVKEAAIATMETLDPEDRVGVLAFDHRTRWITQPINADRLSTFKTRIAKLQSGGGTRILPALRQAGRALAAEDSGIKHMILLSDGRGETVDFQSAVERFRDRGITLSTVAVGEQVQLVTMMNLAEWGGGKMYNPKQFSEVPQIFTSEVRAVANASEEQEQKEETPPDRPPDQLPAASETDASQEEPETKTSPEKKQPEERPRPVTVNEPAPFLEDLPVDDLPPVHRLLPSERRDQSLIPLVAGTDPERPFLGYRYTGTGVAGLLLAPMNERAAPDWLSWDPFPRFVGQTARFLARKRPRQVYNPSFTVDRKSGSPRLKVRIRVPELQDEDTDGTNVTLSRRTETENEWRSTKLERPGTGRYETELVVPRPGAFVALRLRVKKKGKEPYVGFHFVPSTVPEEFRTNGVHKPFLKRVRNRGGTVYSDLASALEQPVSEPEREKKPFPNWPLAFLSVVIVADIYLIRSSG